MNNDNQITEKEGSEQTPAIKTKATGFMPRTQFDVLTLAENVLNKWAETPQITLLWSNPTEFKKLVVDYRNFLQERVEVGSGRGSQTQTLKNLDSQINEAVEEVKLAILVKFGRNTGKAYFSEFGIVKQNARLTLPTDRNQRANSLSLLAKAIKNHSIQVAGFDNAFFESIQEQYKEALQVAQKTDSNIAISVGNKNDLRKQVEAVIGALHTLIKVNYPNTYEGELRGWGFQKEKY